MISEEQKTDIRNQFQQLYDIDPDQISFGDDGLPIFDYEAVSLLALRLTDLKSIHTVTDKIDVEDGIVTATCTVELPDGRTRTTSASSQRGETIGSGETARTLLITEAVANARAARRGLRAAGINLWKAHLRYVALGEMTNGHTNHDPDAHLLAEIHATAKSAGLIQGTNRAAYEKFIALHFDGRTSSKDLSTDEKRRLADLLRVAKTAVTAFTNN